MDMSMLCSIRRTMLGLCFGHIYNIFASRCLKWLKISLERHAYQIEEYHSMSNYCDHIRAMLGPCLGHIRAMFWLFLQQLCFYMHEMAQIFTGESCKPNRRIPFSVKLFGPYKGHVWPILGPCFVYFYNMLASRCRKRLKFSPKFHTCHKENTLWCWLFGTI